MQPISWKKFLKNMLSNMINKSKVGIIILNWNGWNDTIECLESLFNIAYTNYDVIVVDNGSNDESINKIKEYCEGKIEVKSRYFHYNPNNKPIGIVEYVKDEIKNNIVKNKKINNYAQNKKIILIKNTSNYGYAKANNIGITYALEKLNSDYVLLLNNDIVLDKMVLEELVEVGNRDNSIGITGATNYYYDNPNKFWFCGGKINFWNGNVIKIGENELDKGQYNIIKEVDYVAGTCLLIKKEVIEKVGKLDCDYFAYWEEADFCIRAKKAGYKIIHVPKGKIWHKISSTSKKITGFFEYYNTRNIFLFMKKHASRIQFFSFVLWFFLYNFWFISSMLIYQKNTEALFSFYKGLKDGLIHIIKI